MRPFHFAGAVVLILNGLLATAPVRAAEVDQLVPGDARIVAHVDLQQILDASLTKQFALDRLKTALKKTGELQQLLDALGLDPFKDFDSVTLAGTTEEGSFQGLAIVHGRFNFARVQEVARQFARDHPELLKIDQQDGLTVLEVANQRSKGEPIFVAILDQDVLVVSPAKARILEAKARREGKKITRLNGDLQTLVGTIDGRQSVWLAGLVTGDMKKELGKSLLGKDKAAQVRSFTGGVRLRDSVQADLVIQTTSAHTASDMRKMLAGLRAIVAYAAANGKKAPAYGPVLADVIHSIKIAGKQGTVTVHLQITASQIEKSLRHLQQQ